MAFINREDISKHSRNFVRKLGAGHYAKPRFTEKSDFSEDLSHHAFTQFINSASYVLMQVRRDSRTEGYCGY